MSQIERGTQQPSDDNLSQRVVTEVADASGVDPLELPPLYDVIDPDALDQLFDAGFSGRGQESGRVTFTFAGCEVVVRGDGVVDVTAASDSGASPSVGDRAAE